MASLKHNITWDTVATGGSKQSEMQCTKTAREEMEGEKGMGEMHMEGWETSARAAGKQLPRSCWRATGGRDTDRIQHPTLGKRRVCTPTRARKGTYCGNTARQKTK
ncbi:unnamed protein product [Prorocentrum cordatum]|uniref:Uncharacterized protein n=1 Tax=Prorocentrum cordatum TaxID=2364126 RepID=A0ABN9T0M1_9DINO|nr:unnamed protein product [Polarella glacialis]